MGEETPFAMIELPSGRYLQRFKQERLEFGFEEARRALLATPPEVERYALAWVGFLTIQGIRYESVLIDGGERGKPRGARMGLRYRRRPPEVKFEAIGNPMILGAGDNLLTLSGEPDAASKLRPVFAKITADVDHNKSAGNAKAPPYEFDQCQELILSFGDLDLPFRKELQKKPDTVHVIMGPKAWGTTFKPEAKEVYLGRDTLIPLRGGVPFQGFRENGLVLIGYMPPPPTGAEVKNLNVLVLWMASFKTTDKEGA
ncbi:MAG: hypothetical protein JRM99_06430 [Nitrososphaerota archaeon]|nr:hypothetical protein [Nitrososphaerota archaeon]